MDCPYAFSGAPRHSSRLVAVQILYQIKQADISVDDSIAQLRSWIEESDASSLKTPSKKKRIFERIDTVFVDTLVRGFVNYKNNIEECLKTNVSSNFDRLPLVLRCVLEIAVYELLYEIIPYQVVINEYIEITKCFFDEKEQAFVNSLLDKIRKNIQT